MVSVYPNLHQEQGYFSSFKHMGGDPMETGKSMGFGSGLEDPNKKVRKPYTITKSRESWSEQEHDKFLEALHLFDRDWKKIEAFVGSKTVIQIRSHAQKYFMKVQKNGTSEHVPPPRPKRKAAHPYPQKAPKFVAPTQPLQSSAVDSVYNIMRSESVIPPRNTPLNASVPSSWTAYNVVPPISSSSDFPKDHEGFAPTHNYSSSSNDNESNAQAWTCNEAPTSQVKEKDANDPNRAMPDFAQVYSFIGSVFDPNTNNHLQRLKKMDAINVETALMMMKNLSVNLASPEFNAHQRNFLSSSIN